MNEYERCVRDCKLGIKATQNVDSARLAFERLATLVESTDYLLLAALFHAGVVRYAKPFVSADLGHFSATYPTKHLKAVAGFDMAVHLHLLNVRNTLIAHDDFTQIAPRLLVIDFVVRGAESLPVPTTVALANKCVSHPADLSTVEKMTKHIQAALAAIHAKLCSDVERLRKISLEKPELAKASVKYKGPSISSEITVGGSEAKMPDALRDPWFNPGEPDFSHVHNGYRYQTYQLKRDFHGPETIQLPNGHTLVLKPTTRQPENGTIQSSEKN